jgi:hypothetical protein
MPGAETVMHNMYAGKEEYLTQMEQCMAEYAVMQECLVQMELCMLNMMACKNAWCRGSYAC